MTMIEKQNFGFDLLQVQAGEAARERAEDIISQLVWCRNDLDYAIWGDSEIEKLLFLALYAVAEFGAREHEKLLRIGEENELPPVEQQPNCFNAYIQRQVQITENWRADFVFYAPDHCGRILKRPGWRKLIIECDGHEFHERTKDQAARDRSRDRLATQSGREIMRFTGSEIWRDPWECAVEVYDWAGRSWG